jgi:ABC-type antimicrobial peptide transport system permease subunit
VIGVVGTVLDASLVGQGTPTVYLPGYPGSGSLVIRSAGANPGTLVPAVREILADLDPLVAPASVRTMEERLASWSTIQRFMMVLLSVFASAALFLGLVGLYGVISFSVGQRTREFGIRMALGARSRQVLAHVLGQGMRMVALGVVVGLAAAAGLTRLLSSLLLDVSPLDPLTYAVVPLLLALAAALACYIPARRAAGVDPAVTLRQG